MKKSQKKIVLWAVIASVPVVIAGAVLAWFLLSSGPGDTGPNLFIIQRSKNANEVHYDVQVGADGKLADEPVVAYWVLKAEDGGREDLSFFERKAYGFEVMEPDSNGDREMKLVAWEKRTIRLTQTEENGQWRAVVQIDGKDAYLNRMFIQTDESGLTPSVEYVDLFGETVDGGDPVEERITED